jgi:hypothetical protein
MRKGNAALFLLVVSAVSLAITAFLAQQELTVRRLRAVVGSAPTGRINSIPQSALVAEQIDIEAQVDDADKNLADPLSVFSDVIKIYYSNTASPTNPNEWTEIPASQAVYQCYTDAEGDHCKIFARWTPPKPGTFTFMVNGIDKAGNKCSGNPYFDYAGQTDWVRCSIAEDDWRRVTVTATAQVAGHIRGRDGEGIANVSVGIYPEGTKEYIARTDANGYYSLLTKDLPPAKLYSVRAQSGAPVGYKSPPKTTNTTNSLNTVTNANTPADSPGYDSQKVGQSDCGKIEAGGIGCDFVYEKITATPTPTPTPTLTPTPTPTQMPYGTFKMSIAPSATVNLTVGQDEEVTVTILEDGQPIKEPNAYTYKWTVQPNDQIIDVQGTSPRARIIKGLNVGQVYIHISLLDETNDPLVEGFLTVKVAAQSPTPSPQVTSSPSPSPTPIASCLKDKGDSNCDGRINLTDYAIWRQEYLGDCTSEKASFEACGVDRDGDSRPIDADFNLDGLVRLVDFAIWRQNVQ